MFEFISVEELVELENNRKWEDARNLLYSHWASNRYNLHFLSRLATECWYVLTEWDRSIDTSGLSFSLFKNNLIESTEFGEIKYNKDPFFLSLFGYMISMFPFLFFQGDSDMQYLDWENKGVQMLKLAASLDNDPIIQTLYLGSTDRRKEYEKAKKDGQIYLGDRFRGNTEIEKYFFEILS